MKALRLLASRWVLSFVGVAIVALLVWFFGPLLPSLEGWMARLAVVLGLLVVWAAANLVLDIARRRREQKLERGVTERPAGGDEQGGSEEAAALRERMSTALALLKKARGTRGYLYEQPWYVIIGPPGAGKTTALLNSGLKFPLASEMGQGAVAGVGGTRLCDWWFTENAVLIDTAGRYTTQDSNATVDRAGWDAFLDLLHRSRPRQPLNGVIVAIALSDIAAAPQNERLAHARAVAAARQGAGGAPQHPPAGLLDVDQVGPDRGLRRILRRSSTASGANRSGGSPSRSASRRPRPSPCFPTSCSCWSTASTTACSIACRPSRARIGAPSSRAFPRRSPAWRSPCRPFSRKRSAARVSTRRRCCGASISRPAPRKVRRSTRLTGVMMRAFGLDQRRAAALRPVQGRSYFLGQLVSRVIFGEAMLVSEPPSARMRRFVLRSASYAVVALLTLAAAGWLVVNRSASEREVGEMSAALETYERIAKETTFDPVNDADLPRLLPLLDAARDLANVTKASSPLLAGFDLSQSAKLRGGAESVYRHALGYALLPRLVWRLEAQMRGYFTQPDFLYEATRVYLMLGGPGPARPLAGQGMDDIRLAGPSIPAPPTSRS